MKVGKFNRAREQAKSSVSKQKGVSVKHSPFLDKLHQQQLSEMSLEEALEKIDHYADQLRKNPTFENLHRFKQTVRAFLHSTLDKLYIVEQQSFYDPHGRRRLYVLVQNVDVKLEELTQQFLTKQSSAIELARRLDEIRGMLLDLYT